MVSTPLRGKTIIGIDDNSFKLGGHSLKAAVDWSPWFTKYSTSSCMHRDFNLSTIRKLRQFIQGAGEQNIIHPLQRKEILPQNLSPETIFFMEQLKMPAWSTNQLMTSTARNRKEVWRGGEKLINAMTAWELIFYLRGSRAKGPWLWRNRPIIPANTWIEDTMISTGKTPRLFFGKGYTLQRLKELIEHFVSPLIHQATHLLRLGWLKSGEIKILGWTIIVFPTAYPCHILKRSWELYDEKNQAG